MSIEFPIFGKSIDDQNKAAVEQQYEAERTHQDDWGSADLGNSNSPSDHPRWGLRAEPAIRAARVFWIPDRKRPATIARLAGIVLTAAGRKYSELPVAYMV